MNFSQKWILLIITALLSGGCAVIQPTPQVEQANLTSENISTLNGRYSNNPTSSEGTIYRELNDQKTYRPQSFWSQIDGYEQGGNEQTWSNQIVEIRFVSDKKAVASLYENGALLKQKTIRGEIKDDYFYRRPFFVGVPLFPLLFGYKTYRYRIGLSNDLLVLDYKWNLWAFALLAGQSSKGQSHSEFQKIDIIK